MSNVIPISRERAERVENAPAPRSRLLMHYRVTLPPALRRCWRYARLTAEATGWMLFAGLAAMALA